MDSLSVSGCWTHTEKLLHINRLELEAVFCSLQSFEQFLKGKTVRLCTGNTTVACYVNKEVGAQSTHLCLRTEDMLLWCQSRGISLSARHIPGKLNIVADALSAAHRVFSTQSGLCTRPLYNKCGTCGFDPWWTCSPRNSTGVSPCTSHRSQIREHGQWMQWQSHGRTC